MINLIFYIDPVPKALPRSTFGDGSVNAFNVDRTTGAMAFIKLAAIRWADENGIKALPFYEDRRPLCMQATFVKPRPKSLPKKVKYPAVRPDLDNYCKLLCDALKGVIFADDSQIVGMSLEKEFVSPGGLPRVDVSFWEADPADQPVKSIPKWRTNDKE